MLIDFSEINTVRDLSVHIGCSESLIARVIHLNDAGGPKYDVTNAGIIIVPAIDPERTLYRQVKIRRKNPKRRMESRTVWVMEFTELANAQKALLRRLYDYVITTSGDFPACVQGYVRDRSTMSNAAKHCGALRLLNVDIKDFFPSISTSRVSASLIKLNLTPAGANLVARFSTIGGILPLGFNASPLLANIVCRELDAKMEDLARRYECVYTRYADDMSFSSNECLPARPEIAAILEEEGFSIAENKFRMSKRGQRHRVTGLSISDSKRPRLPRAFKRRLRQIIYYCSKFGVTDHLKTVGQSGAAGLNKIDGRIAYAKGIEPELEQQLFRKWKNALMREGIVIRYPSRTERAPRKVTVVFDESVVETPAGRVFILCCAMVDDPDGVRAQLEDLLGQIIIDPFSAGRKSTLRKRGLHYTDDVEDTRTSVIKLISELPVRAFIVYALQSETFSYEEMFNGAFRRLLLHRFLAADHREVDIVYEENSQVDHSVLEETVERLYVGLVNGDERRPISRPPLMRATKENEPLLSLPDYFLGVFSSFALLATKAGKTELVERRFERLRDRLRLITSIDTAARYSRHRPFRPWKDGDPRSSS